LKRILVNSLKIIELVPEHNKRQVGENPGQWLFGHEQSPLPFSPAATEPWLSLFV